MSIESPLKQYHHSFLTIHLINLFRAKYNIWLTTTPYNLDSEIIKLDRYLETPYYIKDSY